VALADTLLDEIYAAPDDDGVRSIYADYLIERGDPLGTFISLQLGRARDRIASPSDEEQQLLDTHWRAWIGDSATQLSPLHVAFERGFFSECDLTDRAVRITEASITVRPWSRLRALMFGARHAVHLPKLLAVTHRSLRFIGVPGRASFEAVTQSNLPLRLETIALAYDLSRDPPPLGTIANLPTSRTLTLAFHCLAEFAARWIDRADEANIRHVILVFEPQTDYVRAALARAQDTRIATLALELPHEVVCHLDRTNGALAIRTVELRACMTAPREQLAIARHWLNVLDAFVDPDLKVTMPEVTAELGELADSLRLKLVRASKAYAARPRLGA
jgi:uncharacterized protein (TIGR02996 family)